jgi:hypothetical protein
MLFIISNFDLWMSKGAHDVFALVISFLGMDKQFKHITIGLLEIDETKGQVLERNLIEFIRKNYCVCEG